MNRSIEQIKLSLGFDDESERLFTMGRVFRADQKNLEVSEEDLACLSRTIGRAVGEIDKSRIIMFVASDETVDSYGDILRVDGCDLSRFKSGAAAFISSHDISDIDGACGVIVSAKKAKNVEGSPDGKAVLVAIYFPTEEEDEMADKIFRKYKAGTLNAVSVGLMVSEYNDPPQDSPERKALGLGKWGIEVLKWQPYELSAVTVGANPNARMMRSISRSALNSRIDELLKKMDQLLASIGNKPEDTGNGAKAIDCARVRSYLEENPIRIDLGQPQ